MLNFNLIFGDILNYIGGVLRWLFGLLFRSIFKKQKFTFEEYIYGSKDPNYYDKMGHRFNNIIIAVIFIGALFSILL